jgi:hypothetical protein
MVEHVEFHVHRRLDNRFLTGPDADDQSPVGWELHNRRRNALHDVFDNVPGLTVPDWADVDDEEQTHELVVFGVEIEPATLTLATSAGGVAMGWIGAVLKKVLTDKAADGVKALVARLRGKQDEQKIADVTLFVGGVVVLRIDPSAPGSGELQTRLPDGHYVRASWGMTEEELHALEESQD